MSLQYWQGVSNLFKQQFITKTLCSPAPVSSRWNPAVWCFSQWTMEPTTLVEQPDKKIRSLFFSSYQLLWLGSLAQGLEIYDLIEAFFYIHHRSWSVTSWALNYDAMIYGAFVECSARSFKGPYGGHGSLSPTWGTAETHSVEERRSCILMVPFICFYPFELSMNRPWKRKYKDWWNIRQAEWLS